MRNYFEKWQKWPTAAKYASGVLAYFIVRSLLWAVRADEPASAFGRYLFADIIHQAFPLAALAIGILVGIRVSLLTRLSWLPWVVGIATVGLLGALQQPIAAAVGVDDLLKSMEAEHDGDDPCVGCRM